MQTSSSKDHRGKAIFLVVGIALSGVTGYWWLSLRAPQATDRAPVAERPALVEKDPLPTAAPAPKVTALGPGAVRKDRQPTRLTNGETPRVDYSDDEQGADPARVAARDGSELRIRRLRAAAVLDKERTK